MAASQKNTSYEKKNSTNINKNSTKTKNAANAKTKSSVAKKRNVTQTKQTKSADNKKPDAFIENKTPYYNEIILGTTLIISGLLLLSLFGLVPKWIMWLNDGVFGLIGVLGYIFPFALLIGVAFGIANRGNSFARRKLISSAGLFWVVTAFLQFLSTGYEKERTILDYFTLCAKGRSGGGLLGGFLMTILCKTVGSIAACFILIVVSVILIMFITDQFIFSAIGRNGLKQMKNLKAHQEQMRAERKRYYEELDEEEEKESIGNPVQTHQKAKIVTFPKNKKLEYTSELDTKAVQRKLKQSAQERVQEPTEEKQESGELTAAEREAILRAQKKSRREFYGSTEKEDNFVVKKEDIRENVNTAKETMADKEEDANQCIEEAENTISKKIPLYKEVLMNKFKKKNTTTVEKPSYTFISENQANTQIKQQDDELRSFEKGQNDLKEELTATVTVVPDVGEDSDFRKNTSVEEDNIKYGSGEKNTMEEYYSNIPARENNITYESEEENAAQDYEKNAEDSSMEDNIVKESSVGEDNTNIYDERDNYGESATLQKSETDVMENTIQQDSKMNTLESTIQQDNEKWMIESTVQQEHENDMLESAVQQNHETDTLESAVQQNYETDTLETIVQQDNEKDILESTIQQDNKMDTIESIAQQDSEKDVIKNTTQQDGEINRIENAIQQDIRTEKVENTIQSETDEMLQSSEYDPIEDENIESPEATLEKLAAPIHSAVQDSKARTVVSENNRKDTNQKSAQSPVMEKTSEIEKTSEKEKTSEMEDLSKAIEIKEEKPYVFPPIDLLTKPDDDEQGMSDDEIREKAVKLKQTLDSFGVRVTLTDVSCGPTVTRFELQPEQGVKVSKITGLTDDIKLNLAAADIRIEAPIPGKAAVGIEVPNSVNTMVLLRDLIESKEFKSHKSNVAFAVGKDIGGKTVVTDVAKMPHLLIAGATGSGKSVCINTLIMSILYKADPKDVKLIMIDPKIVELSVYNGIPHLLIPVVTDPKKASGALSWAVAEMTERYNKFAELGVREINGYNKKVAAVEDANDPRFQKMPQIVIIVDELADLMMVEPGEVEESICRLAQLARAAGIHLVIATQRPSVNVITGLIKANIPSRIAFSVSSAIDSRTILDGGGAEKLLGKGDMLFFPSGFPKPVRVQGAFVSDNEVTAVVEFLKQQVETPQYNEDIHKQIETIKSSANIGGAAKNDRDDYFIEAGKFIIEKDKASIGMLQRVFKVGFNRAARIMDQLSEAGVVGPEEGTKPRKVIMSLEEFETYIDEYY